MRVKVLLLTILLGAGTSLQAQARTDSVSQARRLTISGYAEASYSYSTQNDGNRIVGRLYDRFHDQAELNALALIVDLPPDPAEMSAGVHAELLVGQNAAVIKSAGLDLGSQGDVPQLYATLNVPTANGNGVQIKFGRMPTLLGMEVIEDVANPNWSVGNQFIYVENFTQTGLSVEHKFNSGLNVQVGVFNGWDVVEDNNTRKSFMARVGIAPANATVALLGFYGPEQARNPTANRYGAEALLGIGLSGPTALWFQGDVGHEEANAALPDPSDDAGWWALGAWITHDFSRHLALAIRGDHVDDQDGARTSGVLGFPAHSGQRLGSITATFNVRSWEGLLLRPELRYDRSSLRAFNGVRDQVTFSVSTACLF